MRGRHENHQAVVSSASPFVPDVISPGGAYGPNGEGFFRISLTTPEDRLLEALERLRQL